MKKKKKKFFKKNKFKKKKKKISRPSKKIKKARIKRRTKKKSKKIYKKIKLNNLVKSLITRFNIDLKALFKKITLTLIKVIENSKKRRDKINKKKIADYEKEKNQKVNLRKELLKKEIKEEQVLAKIRARELKTFLRNEQKVIREKEKEKQRKFLEEVQLEKTLERFRARELQEIKEIEKYSLNIEKEDYKEFQSRIDQVREKYKALRNERLRKRVEELGVVLSDQASVEEIRRKEKEYLEKRELIETSLESFTRSAISLVYQINKRYLPKNADLLRVINLVYEQSEIIIREDQEQNENFLILIYVKDQDEKKEIIVEDKIKNETREYNRNAIFKFGDDLTDSLILYLERMRENFKKAS